MSRLKSWGERSEQTLQDENWVVRLRNQSS